MNACSVCPRPLLHFGLCILDILVLIFCVSLLILKFRKFLWNLALKCWYCSNRCSHFFFLSIESLTLYKEVILQYCSNQVLKTHFWVNEKPVKSGKRVFKTKAKIGVFLTLLCNSVNNLNPSFALEVVRAAVSHPQSCSRQLPHTPVR